MTMRPRSTICADPHIDAALQRALDLGEVGVSVAAYFGDELVVDAWTGRMAEGDGPPVQRNTLFPVFSVTKAMVATALHLQVERGLVDDDEPVATYWPELGANGKGDVTVRHVLCHQSGLAAMPPETIPALVGDWDWVTTRLAAMPAVLPPGDANAYHALSFGWLVGEVVRRTDPAHRLPGAFLRDEVLEPYDIEDVWLSLPAEHDERVATLTTTNAPQPDFAGARLRNAATPPAVAPTPDVYNGLDMRRACNPSAGAVATARDVARLFALLANGGTLDGKRLLSEERVRSFVTVRPNNDRVDEVAGAPTSVGIGGLWVRDDGGERPDGTDVSGLPLDAVLGPGRNVLYHTGAGGTVAFADLDQRLAVAICHNRMFGPLPPERHPWVDLAAAVRSVVAG